MSREERRTQRSEQPDQALSLLLSACRERGQFEALIVSDDVGLLVAASHEPNLDVDVEEVAAVLPEPERRRAVRSLRTTVFGVDGQTLYVGAIGGDKTRFAPELQATLRGVRRILAA